MDCRICQEEGDTSDLIVPCKCKGSCKYVHRTCLDTWRETDTDESLTRCPNCHAEYEFEIYNTKSREYYIANFLVFFESAIMLVFIQCLLISFSYGIYKYDSNKYIQKEYCKFLRDDEIKTCYYFSSFIILSICMIVAFLVIGFIIIILSPGSNNSNVIIINNGPRSAYGCGAMSKGFMIFSSISLLIIGISVVLLMFIWFVNYVINKRISSIGKSKYVRIMKVKNLELNSMIV
jgi:hypothetical protein